MMLDSERLSYRTLDVEQIGSVYEAIMGFRIELTTGWSIAVRSETGRFYCSSDGSERCGLIQGLAISFSAWQCGGHGNAAAGELRH